jgi:hypothetical protein
MTKTAAGGEQLSLSNNNGTAQFKNLTTVINVYIGYINFMLLAVDLLIDESIHRAAHTVVG